MLVDLLVYFPCCIVCHCHDACVVHGFMVFAIFAEKISFFGELCWGKAVVAYTKPQKREERRKRKAKRRERSDQVY